jgi:hypothetical protein
MASIQAVVYDPPAPGFPFLGVVLIDDELKFVLPCSSAHEAEAAIEDAARRVTRLAEEEAKSKDKPTDKS